MNVLESAWARRFEASPIRIFHGPSEGLGELKRVSIDRFGEHYWITLWDVIATETESTIRNFLLSKKAKSAVLLQRPRGELPQECTTLLGEPPKAFEITEDELKFRIKFSGVRHPGLFLDHAPLRRWLCRYSKGLKVLNTFAYTGSLSIAARAGGAAHVTTLDLSNPAIEWARENWALNNFDDESRDFISGDIFEWLPRFRKLERQFDCIILDPPSSSRSKKGHFSTAKNLPELHALAMPLLSKEGLLITSINSIGVSWTKFETDIKLASEKCSMKFNVLQRIDQPESFPSNLEILEQRYLKGFILQRRL